MRLASLALILVASAHVACGGKAIADEFNADGGADTAGSDTSAIPTDGPIGSEASPTDGVVVDAPKPTAATCTKFVGGICNTKTEACCKVAGFPWDKDACNTGLDYYCNALVDEVALGRATYNESFLEACVRGWEESLAQCEVSGLESAKFQIPCAQLFNGIIALGDKCKGNRYAECKAPPGFGAYCDIRPGSKEGVCRGYGFVGMGAPCNYTGTTIRYCETGLYCDVSSATSTCKTQKKLGEACAGPDDYSCGFSARCEDSKCVSLGAAGAACTNSEECISYDCTDLKCTKPTEPVVSAWMCNGTM